MTAGKGRGGEGLGGGFSRAGKYVRVHHRRVLGRWGGGGGPGSEAPPCIVEDVTEAEQLEVFLEGGAGARSMRVEKMLGLGLGWSPRGRGHLARLPVVIGATREKLNTDRIFSLSASWTRPQA